MKKILTIIQYMIGKKMLFLSIFLLFNINNIFTLIMLLISIIMSLIIIPYTNKKITKKYKIIGNWQTKTIAIIIFITLITISTISIIQTGNILENKIIQLFT